MHEHWKNSHEDTVNTLKRRTGSMPPKDIGVVTLTCTAKMKAGKLGCPQADRRTLGAADARLWRRSHCCRWAVLIL
jgi:hypothetical protein